MTKRADAGSAAVATLQRAVLLLQKGDAQLALEAANAACNAAPQLSQAYYVRGQALSALGNHAASEEAFSAALELAPDWIDAWINFGIARYRQGALDGAVAAMREVLRRAPGHAVASANLGAFLRLAGDADAAENVLREAIAREPGNAGARLNLAAELLREERAGDALELLEAGEPPVDDARAARHWHLQHSLALLQLGRPIDARAILEKLAALGPVPADTAPLWHWRQVLLARLEGKAANAGAHAALMEAALDAIGPRAVPEHRIAAHFDLGSFWSEQNDARRAFQHWLAGHALLRRNQPFSRDDHLALVEASMKRLDRPCSSGEALAEQGAPAPVFIVGLPGVGTKLCRDILAAHGEVHCVGRGAVIGRTLVALKSAASSVPVEEAAARYLTELRALAPDKARIVDKLPGGCLDLGLVGLMLPQARIIECVDDPRDTGLAIISSQTDGAQAPAHDLADLGWYIGQHDRLMAHWRTVLPNPILTVAHADWSRDFAGTLARVLAHLDLPPDSECSRPRRVERPGRWRGYAQELAPLIEALQRFGSYRFEEVDAGRTDAGPADPGDGERPFLAVFQPDNKPLSLGYAVEYLRRQAPFSDLSFGSFSGTLVGQVRRGQCLFIVDEAKEVRGFLGWCLTSEEHGQAWLAGKELPPDNDFDGGDCVIVNAWAADSKRVVRMMLNEGRKRLDGKRLIFFKRFYPDGRRRGMRLGATKFVDSHLARLDRRRNPS